MRQSFPATSQRCATRPGLLDSAWSFVWKQRGATRPDGCAALASGNRLMPQAEGASSTPDWEFGFSEILPKTLLGTQNDPLGRSGRSFWEPGIPFWELWEPNPAPEPPQGCGTYGPGSPPEAEIIGFTIGKQGILKKPTSPCPASQRLPTPGCYLARYR